MTGTLHWDDSRLEIHKLVVGPMDNNVYVLRCKHTGDAVLIDAANEHERLLDLCTRLGVRRVLETHGHWDHIQAVPAIRDAGYDVAVTHTSEAGVSLSRPRDDRFNHSGRCRTQAVDARRPESGNPRIQCGNPVRWKVCGKRLT